MTLTVSSITPRNGTEVAVDSNTQMELQGATIQTVYVRTDDFSSVSSVGSGDGNEIPGLTLTIAPKRADSWIWLRWTIHYEVHHDTVFTVKQNGSLIGFNRDRGNVRFSGILTPQYDNNYGSTPQSSTINWFTRADNTDSRTYDLCIRSSSNATHTFRLNRAISSFNSDSYEQGISYGFAREICG